ncbi:uncharacterized protein cenpt [Synchiropus picturatus]
MDPTEDLSARVLLKHILTTEPVRTPITRSASKAQGNAVKHQPQSSSKSRVKAATPRTPQDILRRSMRDNIHKSISRTSLPASKKKAALGHDGRGNSPESSSVTFTYEGTPRDILKNILHTEPAKSPVVHEKTPEPEPNAPQSVRRTSSRRSSTELSGLDLGDVTAGNFMSPAKGLSRKRQRRSLNVTAFEKRLRTSEVVEEPEQPAEDLSSLSLSSTSLSLKTPFAQIHTEKRGLQRRASNRKKITEQEFDEAVKQRQLGGHGTDTTVSGKSSFHGFTLCLRDQSDMQVTHDIINCNTALYSHDDHAIPSNLSIIATQDKPTVMASQLSRDLGEEQGYMEEVNVRSQSEEEVEVRSQSEEEVEVRSQSEEDVNGRSQSEEDVDIRSQSEEEVDGRSQSEEDVDARSQTKEEDDGKSQSEEDDDGKSQSEEEVDARSQSEEDVDGRSQSEEEVDGKSQSEEEVDARSQSEEEVNGRSQSEEEVNGRSQSEEEVDARSQSEEEVDARSQSEEEVDARSQSEEEVDGKSQSEEEVDARSQSEEEIIHAGEEEEEEEEGVANSDGVQPDEDGATAYSQTGDEEDAASKEPGEQEEWEESGAEDIPMETPAFVRQKRRVAFPNPAPLAVDAQAEPSSEKRHSTPPKPKVRQKKPATAKKRTSLPKSYLMASFKHFAKTRVSGDVYPVLSEIMEQFFDRLMQDVETYAAHAKRKTIEVEDVVLLLKRQGHVNDKVPVEVLIEKYLRMQQRKLLIPIATSGNVVVPKSRRW